MKKLQIGVVCLIFFFFGFVSAAMADNPGPVSNSEAGAQAGAEASVSADDNSVRKSKNNNINIVPPINPAPGALPGQPTLILRDASAEMPKHLKEQGWVYIWANPSIVDNGGFSEEMVEAMSAEDVGIFSDNVKLGPMVDFGAGISAHSGVTTLLTAYPSKAANPNAQIKQVGEREGQGYALCPDSKVAAKVAKTLKALGANAILVVGNKKHINKGKMWGIGSVGAGGGAPSSTSALGAVTGFGYAQGTTWMDEVPRLMVLGFHITGTLGGPIATAPAPTPTPVPAPVALAPVPVLPTPTYHVVETCASSIEFARGSWVPLSGQDAKMDIMADWLAANYKAITIANGWRVALEGNCDETPVGLAAMQDTINPTLGIQRGLMVKNLLKPRLKARGLTDDQIIKIEVSSKSNLAKVVQNANTAAEHQANRRVYAIFEGPRAE